MSVCCADFPAAAWTQEEADDGPWRRRADQEDETE